MKKVILFLFFLALYSTSFHGTSAQYLGGEDLEQYGAASCNIDLCNYPSYQNLGNSIVKLINKNSNSEHHECTGSLIKGKNNQNYILTAYHCLEDKNGNLDKSYPENVDYIWGNKRTNCSNSINYYSGNGRAGASLVYKNKEKDFALLRPLTELPNYVKPLKWSKYELNEGDKVTVLHHPKGSHMQITFGEKRSKNLPTWGEFILGENYQTITLQDGALQGGSSGAPILTEQNGEYYLAGIHSKAYEIYHCPHPLLEKNTYSIKFSKIYEDIKEYIDPEIENLNPIEYQQDPISIITIPTSNINIGSPVELNANQSQNAEYYTWTTYKPNGSSVTSSGPSITTIPVTPDIPGTYTIKLTVENGIYAGNKKTSTDIKTFTVKEEYNQEPGGGFVEIDDHKIYMHDISMGKCKIWSARRVVVPEGETWKDITFATRSGSDLILLIDNDEWPSVRPDGKKCSDGWSEKFDADFEFDFYKDGGFAKRTRDLQAGDHIYISFYTYGGVSNKDVNTEITIFYDGDNDGVPNQRDDFPNDPTESRDSDGDWYGDNQDKFPNDPAASKDDDNDGFPDEWNTGKTDRDSIISLEIDYFLNDTKNGEIVLDKESLFMDKGGNGYVDVKLSKPLSRDLTLHINKYDGSEYINSNKNNITFTSINWDIFQRINFTSTNTSENAENAVFKIHSVKPYVSKESDQKNTFSSYITILEKTISQEEPIICTQVMTPAWNIVTREEEIFGSSCEVPDGWIIGEKPETETQIFEINPGETLKQQLESTQFGIESTEGYFITQEPSSGTYTISDNGVLSYTPNENFAGEDTIIAILKGPKELFAILEININTITEETNTLNEGILAKYTFSSNTDDSSGNSHKGNNIGGTLTIDRFGNPNSAYSFDGNTENKKGIYINSVASTNKDKNIGSISLWAKPNTNNSWGAAFAFASNNQNKSYLIVDQGNKKWRWTTRKNGVWNQMYSDNLVRINEWNHIVITSNGSQTKLYINGDLQSQTGNGNWFNDMIGGADKFRIGSYYEDRGDGHWNGGIDDFIVYNKELLQDEISSLYNDGTGNNEENIETITEELETETQEVPGAIATYTFNGNTDDTSGNNHNGNNIGGILTTDRFGNTNSAYNFDGNTGSNKGIHINSVATTNKDKNTGSISFWAKPNTTSTWGATFAFAYDNQNKSYFTIDSSNAKWKWTTRKSGTWNMFHSNNTAIVGKWVHIVITTNGNTSKMYIDSQLQSQTGNGNWFNDMTGGSNKFRIGSYYEDRGDGHWNGGIDDFIVYDKELSQDQVDILYNQK